MPSKKDLDRFRGELGETVVVYELLKREWSVLRNAGGHGYDLQASSEGNRVQRRIEVKTTDPALRMGKTKNQLTVVLSPSEMQASDFCVFYIHGHNTFFLIPRAAYPRGGSITVNIGKDGAISKGSKYEPYRDLWDSLR